MTNNSFSVRLRELREKRRMDRKSLGELCGLSKNIIGQYEHGEKFPSLRTVIVLADYFGVSVDFLLGREKSSLTHYQWDGEDESVL